MKTHRQTAISATRRRNKSHKPGSMCRFPASQSCHEFRRRYTKAAASVCVSLAASRAALMSAGFGGGLAAAAWRERFGWLLINFDHLSVNACIADSERLGATKNGVSSFDFNASIIAFRKGELSICGPSLQHGVAKVTAFFVVVSQERVNFFQACCVDGFDGCIHDISLAPDPEARWSAILLPIKIVYPINVYSQGLNQLFTKNKPYV